MPSVTGHRKRLSLPRRMVCDLLRAARGIPIISFERRMKLAPVAEARQAVPNPPPWVLLFTKAFAAVAARRPEFRRTYLPFPWPHLWEADESIASVAVERDYEGEPGVFFGFFKAPDKLPLAEMAATLNDWRTQPVGAIRSFRRALFFAGFPLAARRLLWAYATSWSGKIKARNFGTFGISLTGTGGATALNLVCPLTTAINTGVFADDWSIDFRLHFDHRVLDGMPVARALQEIEEHLCTELVSELRSLAAG